MLEERLWQCGVALCLLNGQKITVYSAASPARLLRSLLLLLEHTNLPISQLQHLTR
jgi:hypothetical protein